MCWIAVGTFVYGEKVEHLPLSAEGCNDTSVTNEIFESKNNTTAYEIIISDKTLDFKNETETMANDTKFVNTRIYLIALKSIIILGSLEGESLKGFLRAQKT